MAAVVAEVYVDGDYLVIWEASSVYSEKPQRCNTCKQMLAVAQRLWERAFGSNANVGLEVQVVERRWLMDEAEKKLSVEELQRELEEGGARLELVGDWMVRKGAALRQALGLR